VLTPNSPWTLSSAWYRSFSWNAAPSTHTESFQKAVKRFLAGVLSYARGVKPQTAIGGLCVLLILLRFFIPDLKFDNLSLDLLLIAVACILVPDIAALIGRLKKIKVGDKEIELHEAINKIADETERVEEEVADSPYTADQSRVFERQIDKYVRDPRGGLIAVAADIEKRVIGLLRQRNLAQAGKFITPPRGIELLAQHGAVAPNLPALARNFWNVRNAVVHGVSSHVTDADVFRMVDVGVRILDLLSATPTPIQFDNDHTKAGVEAIVQTLMRKGGEETEKDLTDAIGHDFTTTLRFMNEGVRLALLRRTQVRGLDGVTLTPFGKQYALDSNLK
jgi:hypothetical protein